MFGASPSVPSFRTRPCTVPVAPGEFGNSVGSRGLHRRLNSAETHCKILDE